MNDNLHPEPHDNPLPETPPDPSADDPQLDSHPDSAPALSIPAHRSLLAPPGGRNDGVKSIFWNAVELRAGWRLVIYLICAGLIAAAGNVASIALHLPQVRRLNNSASALLVQEFVMMMAAVGAALVLAWLERRTFSSYGLPFSGHHVAHSPDPTARISDAPVSGAAIFPPVPPSALDSLASGAPPPALPPTGLVSPREIAAPAGPSGKLFWQGAVWGLAMISAMLLLVRVFGGFYFGDLALHGAAPWEYAVLWGVVFLCVGVFEEFFFRGYTQSTLASGMGFWPAAAVLSATFGALHLGNAGEDKIGALSVFVFGMFFCLTLRRTGNLWFAVGLHAAFDWGETFLFSVPNSGVVAPGHLLNSSFHGPLWLTGGTVGPEGSAMAFVVLAVTAAVFVWVFPARGGAGS